MLLGQQVYPKYNLLSAGVSCPMNLNWVPNHQISKQRSSRPEPSAWWNKNPLLVDWRLICYENIFIWSLWQQGL